MKFSEAFDKAFELEKERAAKEGRNFAVSPATAKTLAFFWNMMAFAQAEKGLDNFCYIDNNNDIKEIPFDEIKKGKGKKSKSSPDETTADQQVEGDGNGEESGSENN